MLYYEASTKKVHALNGSGRAPAALTLDRCLADLRATQKPDPTTGLLPLLADIPPLHPHSVTVPGAAAGWVDAVTKFGSGALTMSQLLEPAAVLAEEGFPVSPITAFWWDRCAYQLGSSPHGSALKMPSGRTPATGEVFRNPDMASVLRELGTGGKKAFYEGRIAEAMVEVLAGLGGVMTMEDLKVMWTLVAPRAFVWHKNLSWTMWSFVVKRPTTTQGC